MKLRCFKDVLSKHLKRRKYKCRCLFSLNQKTICFVRLKVVIYCLKYFLFYKCTIKWICSRAQDTVLLIFDPMFADFEKLCYQTSNVFLNNFSSILGTGETMSVYVDWRTTSHPFGRYWFAVDRAVVLKPQNVLQLHLRILRFVYLIKTFGRFSNLRMFCSFI